MLENYYEEVWRVLERLFFRDTDIADMQLSCRMKPPKVLEAKPSLWPSTAGDKRLG